MNILDIDRVQHCITELEITAREDGRYMHKWVVSGTERCFSHHTWRDIADGKISVIKVKVNHHGDANKRGLPEMGWGLNQSKFPAEILAAEITKLDMKCSDGVTYLLRVDIDMSALLVEMIKSTWTADDG